MMSKISARKEHVVNIPKVTNVKAITDEHSNTDTDLFNFLRQMHLTGGANGITVTCRGEGSQVKSGQEEGRQVKVGQGEVEVGTGSGLLLSRKRKAWEGLHTGGNKWVGGQRPPALRSSEAEEESHLMTPQCSNTGYEDEVRDEEGEEREEEEEGRHSWEHEEVDDDHQPSISHEHSGGRAPSSSHLLSPIHTSHLLNIDNDIDADNLAADFDGSFTGLGVDINTANYSMSEAMLSLNNIALASHLHTRHESGDRNLHTLHPSGGIPVCIGNGRSISLKSEPPHPYLFSNYGALDLSNDEAQHPEEQTGNDGETTPPSSHAQPPTFSGSVSRENSQDGAGVIRRDTILRNTKEERAATVSPSTASRIISLESPVNDHQFIQPQTSKPPGSHPSVILSYTKPDITEQQKGFITKSEIGTVKGKSASVQSSDDESDSRFQYILAAPTSIATKTGEPSLTYLNQGQSYEIKIKKLGDLSGHYRKKWLRSTIRICFHERRLQYIEAEQIADWSRTHPNERILEIDMPLSYGIADVKQDSSYLNSISFLWDPTRDTGIFVKVNCISTEFTPKKHGGERGVPFRLQVETWSNEDIRLHAAACILQVFKLKGADRKHKQDREKVAKRPDTEKEKFSPQYECTMLTDLSVDSIYTPSSRGISPVQSDSETPSITPQPGGHNGISNLKSTNVTPLSSRDVSPLKVTTSPTLSGERVVKVGPSPVLGLTQMTSAGLTQMTSAGLTQITSGVTQITAEITSPTVCVSQADNKTWKVILPTTANSETAAGWLAYNRYGQYLKTFTDYDARDLLRLSKSDIVQMIGLVDGVRLFNDLHMKPVAPRLILYLAQKGENTFHPVLLQEVTVAELISNVAEILQVPLGLFNKVVISGPNKINIRLTDEFLRFQPQDSAFYYHLIHEEGEACTIHLEHSLKE